jgi:predicted dehydrogenase
VTLRVGIIGCGAISEFHLRAIQSHPECCAVACADINHEAALRRAGQFGIPRTFDDAERLLRLEHLDVVAICAPPKWHVELLLQALAYGKHVLIEKPLAMNLCEADKAVDAAAGTESIVGVALMQRYHPVYDAVRELIGAGALGPLRQVRISMGRDMYGDTRFSDPASDPRSWLVDYSIAGGGIMMSSSIHFLSMVSYILGDPAATHVSGRVRQLHPSGFERIEDDIDVNVHWEDGIEFTLRESWVINMPFRAELLGDAGQLVITGEDNTTPCLIGEFSQPLPPKQQKLLDPYNAKSSSVSSRDSTHQLFFGLWSDLQQSIRLRAHVPRLPGLCHARNMQAIVAAADQAETIGRACAVDWLPNPTCQTS